MSLRIALDRDLPIPIGVQLKGQIEFSIVAGTLLPGERLPSVREMAAAESLAPVTVSHVYAALKREGLITVRPGMGTYVADNGDGPRAGDELVDLRNLVDAMIMRALERGFEPAQIGHMVTARLAGRRARRPVVVVVGPFSHATEVYAHDVAALLADLAPEVAAHTLQSLREHPDERAWVCAADLVLTVANRVKEVQYLLGADHPPVRGLTFITHPDTIAWLRALPRGVTLGVVSTIAEFLPTMLQGIGACVQLDRAPLCAVLGDAERLAILLARSEAIVFASGSEAVLSQRPPGVAAIEYLHTPEPTSVEAVRPLLQRLAGSYSWANSERRWWHERIAVEAK